MVSNTKTQAAHQPGKLRQVMLLFFCIGGIYTAYLTQGIVSEHLAVKRYGPEKERFKQLEGLNGAQSFTCFVWAWLILIVMQLTGQIRQGQTAKWTDYWKAGITNSLGPAFGMVALKNITYSAQVLVKSCKMVPVMIMGTLLHRKRYSFVEYVCMLLIGVGVGMFGLKSSHGVNSKLAAPNTGLGYFLCLINLAFDGYTNAAQDEINKRHPGNPPMHMMCWMNFWTFAYYALYLFGLTSNGSDLIAFCMRHPDAARDVILFCLCGAFGQLFIFATIKSFGSLANTLICTTRKFFNILISVVVNGNVLLPLQWWAVSMVFSGLITSTLLKTKGSKHKSHQHGEPTKVAANGSAEAVNGKEKHA
uniref:UAA transporter n=1 Tax=Chlamydomonas leiostraca TaxID=1034604 RepID=A0A7S0X1H4_9CHLO|mmetsp:Transcript_8430/g.21061  ORF Transcript_8430/g.21061 Transcript_8430/m.21061 type:complete len:362 (+) Transcript_8430:176-1261(+)|eukprot:CAMPEP_0202858820 /NCGR_PEP_ID=MMETSP1391-20130828/1187_1 /ASSEMBLY_ACC=CAM_ASM_000867 /TAXON_ID=1034604 /ORGANISM="Chlamydomonas leiostraca, Strain SAG 11-49" /LENGTH=361 /DNA_ID=CAMNT_0049537781 /DNA_START=89 /DNA_END=1174 /DNA_ORIENTATION=-